MNHQSLTPSLLSSLCAKEYSSVHVESLQQQHDNNDGKISNQQPLEQLLPVQLVNNENINAPPKDNNDDTTTTTSFNSIQVNNNQPSLLIESILPPSMNNTESSMILSMLNNRNPKDNSNVKITNQSAEKSPQPPTPIINSSSINTNQYNNGPTTTSFLLSSTSSNNNVNSMISVQQSSQQPSKSTITTSNNNNGSTTNTFVFHNFKQEKIGNDNQQQLVEPVQRFQQSVVNSTSEHVSSSSQPLVFIEQVNQSSSAPGAYPQPKKKNNKPKETNIPNNFTFHNFANPQPQQPLPNNPSPPMMSTINLINTETQQLSQPNVTPVKKTPTNLSKFTNYQPPNQQTIQFSNYEPVKAQPSTQTVNNNQNNANRSITHQFHITQPPLGQFKITDYSNNYAQPLSHIDYMPSNQIITKNTDSPNPKKRNSTGNNLEGSATKVIKSSKSIVTSNFPTFTNSDFEGCVPSNTFSIQSNQTSLSKNVNTSQEKKPVVISSGIAPSWPNQSPPIQIITNYQGVIGSADQSPKKSNVHASSANLSSSSWTFHSFDQTEQPIKDQSTGLTFHSFNPKKK